MSEPLATRPSPGAVAGHAPSAGPGAAGVSATATFAALERAVAGVVAADGRTLRLAVACVASHGHLLVEDHPGLGKTTLAKALAAAMGLGFHRLQCTADLLPLDVTGAMVLSADGTPVWRPGPIFTNVLMADELNRASPRAQSALLEAMEERQVTMDGQTRPLPDPFFVLATQNPFDAAGTAPLPHGQRDRFLLRLSLGYPSRAQMEHLVGGADPAGAVRVMAPAVTPSELASLLAAVGAVHLSPPVRGYVLDLVEATRAHPAVTVGASPRAARALAEVSRALAVASGRGYVTPDDVQDAAGAALAHRLLLDPAAESAGEVPGGVVAEVLEAVPVPLRAAPE